MTRTVAQTALILGAHGKIGGHLRAGLDAAGWQTRAYTRGTDMSAAARGCDLIVNGLNPPNYHDWARQLPQITEAVLAAAQTSGATVLLPGNVYVYGTQPGPWDETTPYAPCSRKGAIRVALEERYRAAAEAGRQTIVLRGGDYLTPEPADTLMEIVYLRKLARGVVTSLGDPDVPRAYSWLPDMGRIGAALADRRATLPAFCDVPVPGLTFSLRELTAQLEARTGRRLRIKRFPWWLLCVASPFWELAREMREMRYLYDTPHRLSGARLAALLPDFEPTPLDAALTQMLAQRHGFARAA